MQYIINIAQYLTSKVNVVRCSESQGVRATKYKYVPWKLSNTFYRDNWKKENETTTRRTRNSGVRQSSIFCSTLRRTDMQISNLTLAYMKCTYCTVELPNYHWVIVQSLLVLNCQFKESIKKKLAFCNE